MKSPSKLCLIFMSSEGASRDIFDENIIRHSFPPERTHQYHTACSFVDDLGALQAEGGARPCRTR
jgi:hypothetical protein